MHELGRKYEDQKIIKSLQFQSCYPLFIAGCIRTKEIIIQEINERFGVDFTDADKLKHFTEDMQRRLVENEKLARAADLEVNTEDNFKLVFNDYFDDVLNDNDRFKP
ncbi:hypothetical protein EO98_04720 [Methanosarcina sp. 2.H.T.1A.6]|uniref:hypothetical protein n=1 Tax=unclassified Methanosarcina TaxID=2644672 RepID=UPI00062113A6|nr:MULTISPECIES: hypothetical protein [unclassified Methanosarcina]KKG16006.1 hypothetical protein EO94_05160 [Methanosarcina sp. 2.H.T.1A.3]KKG21287.1 hypothetical protein EO98_04720 [Methanosarcina sp. 2.H.T.1A.6]KKG24145.1 hypothetical protein EO96_14205 [Methanosarcina sp. 2.H.T.1A.8]KKG28678.1 hypothetical protein EO97_14805 [Methanosarcina sp. 2.H.T.1A.15]